MPSSLTSAVVQVGQVNKWFHRMLVCIRVALNSPARTRRFLLESTRVGLLIGPREIRSFFFCTWTLLQAEALFIWRINVKDNWRQKLPDPA
jgi:hypothetical protein